MRNITLALLTLVLVSPIATGEDQFPRVIQPMLRQYCFECHSHQQAKGDIDLEQFKSADLAIKQPKVWGQVLEQLANGEMPPKGKPQPSAAQTSQLTAWAHAMLDQAALANAGDPGAVVLRRLSNAEYTYTLRDLTGIDSLDPAKEFPVDGAAGEGFTNVGGALVMSPTLLTKYLDAAKGVAEHVVLVPSGIRFSPGVSTRDWTDESLAKIRNFYRQYTDDEGGTAVNLQGIRFNTNKGGRLPVEKYVTALISERAALIGSKKGIADVARERGLNAKYLTLLWTMLRGTKPSLVLDSIRAKWNAGTLAAADIAVWQEKLWRFTTVGHIGMAKGPKRWQEPVTPLASSIELLLKLQGPADGGDARKQLKTAFDDFRNLFPIALCYAKIVPADDVVTLKLFHREDEPLKRLMLDDAQAKALDSMWDELLFVSEAPLKQVDAFEQVYQFATQDADPSVLNPLRKSIMDAADAYKRRAAELEPVQLQAVIDFSSRAWRRPLANSETAELRSLYEKIRKQDLPHAKAIRMLMARVLVAPAFLYRGEQASPGLQAAPVNDWELATRLSYFLWSSTPDDELISLAASRTLHEPEVLAAQARRMMRNTKVRRIATEFGCQWLHVRDLETLDEKSERHFPSFKALRGDMQEEAVRFFIDLFQADRSVLSLVDADYSFMNGPLARHYGIDVKTDAWQRVEGLHARGRGGILGFASTLSKQSGASRSSPILRGNWLCEVVLGETLPRPPKGVPILPEEAPAGLTERGLIERHSRDSSCARCHQRIDPFGFALERFDAIGRARDRDASNLPIDTSAKLPDGTEIKGLDGLRNYILTKRKDDFLLQFCRKLLGYALGRSVLLSDKRLLEGMLTGLKTNEYKVGVAVEMIVRSPQFREVRGQVFAGNN
jgi:hypothetical protein